MSLNINIILNSVLPGLIGGSIISAVVAVLVGGLIGLIAGARSRQTKRILTPTIIGSFFGTMLIAMLPIMSEAQLWGGGYAGILLMFMALFLIPTGAIAGALIGCSYGMKLAQRHDIKKIMLLLSLATYSLTAIVIYVRYSLHCLNFAWYCTSRY